MQIMIVTTCLTLLTYCHNSVIEGQQKNNSSITEILAYLLAMYQSNPNDGILRFGRSVDEAVEKQKALYPFDKIG